MKTIFLKIFISFYMLIFLFNCSTTKKQIQNESTLTRNESDNQNSEKKKEMLGTCLKWGRLAPLPDFIKNFKIYTEGNLFTREFSFTFNLEHGKIKKWLNECLGIKDAVLEDLGNKKIRYKIKPGEKASSAFIIINWETNEVYFNACWN